jgi:hypothetical protein
MHNLPFSFTMADPPLTAAQLLQRHVEKHKQSNDPLTEALSPKTSRDLDAEIEKLEAELNNDSSSIDDGSDSDSSYNSSQANADDEFKDDDKEPSTGILNLSAVANDRIERLPDHKLPSHKARSKRLKIDKVDDDDEEMNLNKRSKHQKESVQFFLHEYVPRSSERLPFYCRYCPYQAKDEHDFATHRTSPLHLKRVDLERKASYCKLCRKQLTSPAQMKEHLKSKPHHEKLKRAKQIQNGQRSSEGGNSSRQWK